jgi:hypothetical protein
MNTTNHVDSTVFSSMTAGQKYNSVFAQGNIKMTNQSYESQADATTNGHQTPGAHGQKRIKLPNLEKSVDVSKVVNILVPKGPFEFR